MPRTSAAAAVATEFAIPETPLPAPGELTRGQAADWAMLAGTARLSRDQVPLLVELVRAMDISRQIAGEIATMQACSLTEETKAGKAARSVYLQLAAAARDQSRVIAMLSTKLRFARTTAVRKITAERERERAPVGPRPWDTGERHN